MSSSASVAARASFQTLAVQEREPGLASTVRAYLGDLDYRLAPQHLAGLTTFFRRLAEDGLVPDGRLSFLSAA